MALHLNPRFPLVWRTPTSLQFGVDTPVVHLDDVTHAQEHIIAALTGGVTRPGLSLIAESAGGTENELVDLLDRLQPVLGKPVPVAHSTVSVIGTTSTAVRLRTTLPACGLTVVTPDAPAELGILVCHYVVEPELFGFWLSRDIPHLPIVFSDTGVRVGPIVEPGIGPCLYCLECHRTDADAAWPAIVSQLWGRTSPVEGGVVSAEVVALALRFAAQRAGGAPSPVAESAFLDAATGETTRRSWSRHPECGCAALPGNGSEPGRQGAPGRLPTRRGAAAAVPA